MALSNSLFNEFVKDIENIRVLGEELKEPRPGVDISLATSSGCENRCYHMTNHSQDITKKVFQRQLKAPSHKRTFFYHARNVEVPHIIQF